MCIRDSLQQLAHELLYTPTQSTVLTSRMLLPQLFLEDTLRACLLTAPLAPAPPQKVRDPGRLVPEFAQSE
eukprot:571231-Rhodomonas_salina.1